MTDTKLEELQGRATLLSPSPYFWGDKSVAFPWVPDQLQLNVDALLAAPMNFAAWTILDKVPVDIERSKTVPNGSWRGWHHAGLATNLLNDRTSLGSILPVNSHEFRTTSKAVSATSNSNSHRALILLW